MVREKRSSTIYKLTDRIEYNKFANKKLFENDFKWIVERSTGNHPKFQDLISFLSLFFLEKHHERKLQYTNFIIILMKSNKEEKGRAYLVGITLELKSKKLWSMSYSKSASKKNKNPKEIE